MNFVRQMGPKSSRLRKSAIIHTSTLARWGYTTAYHTESSLIRGFEQYQLQRRVLEGAHFDARSIR